MTFMGKDVDLGVFKKYGYDPLYPDAYDSRDRPILVYDTVQAKKTMLSYNKLQGWIKRRHVVEVDPKLNTYTYKTGQGSREDNFRMNAIEGFAQENNFVKELAYKCSNDWFKLASSHKDWTINYEDPLKNSNAENINKAHLYALVDVLKRFPTSKTHNSVLIIRKRKMELYRYINAETIKNLEHMIEYILNSTAGEEELLNDYNFSDMPILLALEHYDSLTIHFEPKNTKGKKSGGFFPYFNISGYDLTRYGIYSEEVFQDRKIARKTFKDNCFIQALVTSGMLSNDEVIRLRSMIFTRMFPRECIKKIAEIFNLHITVCHLRDDNTWEKKKDYNFGSRRIDLCLYKNHYFLSEQVWITVDYIKYKDIIDKDTKINPLRKEYIKYYWDEKYDRKSSSYRYLKKPNNIMVLIRDMIDEGLLIPLTPDYYYNLCSTKQYFTNYDFHNLVDAKILSTSDVPITKPKNIIFVDEITDDMVEHATKINTLDTIPIKAFMSSGCEYVLKSYAYPHVPSEHLPLFHNIIEEVFGVDIYKYSTLPVLGTVLMWKTGCYEGVHSLGGYVLQFIRKCLKKPICQTAYDQKIFIEGDLMQIDRNSSYCSSYVNFLGIPKGIPKILPKIPNLSLCDYYYILVNIISFRCKRNRDAFPLLLNTGEQFFDKVTWETILAHYTVDYYIISGYYYDEGFNTNIKTLALKLYELRQTYQELSDAFKFLINCLWGKSLQKENKTYVAKVNESKVDSFINYNFEYIYDRKKAGNNNIFRLYKPFQTTYRLPQFAVNVANYSRCLMTNIIYDLEFPIYYCNTDSLLFDVSNENEKITELIGKGLGKFHVEFKHAKRFYGITGRTTLVVYNNDTLRIRTPMRSIPRDKDDKIEAWYNSLLES